MIVAAADIDKLLGSPDASCRADSISRPWAPTSNANAAPGDFAPLGGADGGYAVLSFGTGQRHINVENGDRVRVQELAGALCG